MVLAVRCVHGLHTTMVDRIEQMREWPQFTFKKHWPNTGDSLVMVGNGQRRSFSMRRFSPGSESARQ